MFLPSAAAIRYLRPQFHRISKTTFVKGMQCAKYFYLNKFKPELRTPHSAETLQRFSQGKDFESTYKTTFPDAVDVSANLGQDTFLLGVPYTQLLLENNESITLFEACCAAENCLVMTDVLVKNNDEYTIYEVKNARELRPVFLWDLSVQYYVCKKALENIKSFNIVLNDGENGFSILDLTQQLEANFAETSRQLAFFNEMLSQKNMPEVAVGAHCDTPYECEFKAYCHQQ